MADTILSGRWIIYYEAENRNKRIVRDTSVTPTTIDTVRSLYSALQNWFDELNQMDDGTPMSAQTPTEYTIGIIDAGDKDPWFIDRTSVEYLKGGAIKTASWKRVVGGPTPNTGIVRMAYTQTTALDPTDIGRDIKMTTDGDRGTILDYNDTGATKYMWIRPDSNAAANSFDDSPTANGAWTLPTDLDPIGQVWQVAAAGPTFVDQTENANSTATADWTVFPASEATTDYVAIGFRQKFKKVTFDSTSGTAGVGGVVVWEYWNGAWTALSGAGAVTDGTSSFTAAAGAGQNLTFTVPTDWVTTTLNGSAALYYIRARITTVYSTNPIYSQGVIGTTGVGSQAGGTATTGESLWSNIYNTGLANLELFTHQYVYQNAVILKKYKSTTVDWWGDGQIDILINVKELDIQTDAGFVTVLARQYGKTYDNFIVDLSNGGRNPIPMATGADLNNTTGYRQFTSTSGVGTFNVGNFIYAPAAGGWAAATKRGVITKVVGSPGTTPTLDYYLIGDLTLTDFANTDTVKEYTGTADGDASCTSAAPTNVGPPALGTQPTVTFGKNETHDINEDSTLENYSIVINLGSNTVANGYEWTKYITREGGTTTTNTNGIEGERYIGTDFRITYTTLTGTIAEGAVVTQAAAGGTATGTVITHHNTTTPKILIIRNSRGTFDATAQVGLQSDPTNQHTDASPTSTSIAPIKAAPFGTFAGGTWFAAPGVVFDNVLAAEANKYQLTDDNGNVVKAPTKVTITIGNTQALDRIAVFRLTGAAGTIQKNTYNATVQSAGATTAIMGSAIATDEPGKTAGGILRLVDASTSQEYRIRFSSWTASTFTLHNYTFTTLTSGTNSTNIVTTSTEFTNAAVGDLVYNSTRVASSYIISIAGDNKSAVISPAITSQVSTDTIKLDVLPIGTTTTPDQDNWYVPLLDVHKTDATDATSQVTFVANIAVRVRARQAGNILPYEADATVTSSGLSNNVIRTPDTIFQ